MCIPKVIFRCELSNIVTERKCLEEHLLLVWENYLKTWGIVCFKAREYKRESEQGRKSETETYRLTWWVKLGIPTKQQQQQQKTQTQANMMHCRRIGHRKYNLIYIRDLIYYLRIWSISDCFSCYMFGHLDISGLEPWYHDSPDRVMTWHETDTRGTKKMS